MKIGKAVDVKKFGEEAVVIIGLTGDPIVIFAESTFASFTFVGALNSKEGLDSVLS